MNDNSAMSAACINISSSSSMMNGEDDVVCIGGVKMGDSGMICVGVDGKGVKSVGSGVIEGDDLGVEVIVSVFCFLSGSIVVQCFGLLRLCSCGCVGFLVNWSKY